MECINVNDNRRLCVEVTRLDDADKVFVENIVKDVQKNTRPTIERLTQGMTLVTPASIPASAVKTLVYTAPIVSDLKDFLEYYYKQDTSCPCFLRCLQGPTVNGMDIYSWLNADIGHDDIDGGKSFAGKCEYDNVWHDCSMVLSFSNDANSKPETAKLTITLGEGASFNGVDITSILGNGFDGIWISRSIKHAT